MRNNNLHRLESLHFSPCVSTAKLETALVSKDVSTASDSPLRQVTTPFVQDLFLISA